MWFLNHYNVDYKTTTEGVLYMEGILHELFLIADPIPSSPEEWAAIRRFDGLCAALGEKLTGEEADRLLSAAVAVGTADLERSFIRGFQLGMQLTAAGLQGEKMLSSTT